MYIPVITTSPLDSLSLINPSLALDLRKAVKDLYPECLISTGVLVAETSLKDRYGKMYVSEKIEGEIGKDDAGSFESVVAIDWSRADRRSSETSGFSRLGDYYTDSWRSTLLG